MYPINDGRLRITWAYVYEESGDQVITPSDKPSLLQLTPSEMVRTVKFDQFGVLLPEATRDLDRRYFTIGRTNVHYKNIDGKPVRHDSASMTGFPSSKTSLVYPEKTKSLDAFLERFGKPKVGEGIDFAARVSFGSKELCQKWISMETVEFVEVYRGFGEMTIRVAEADLLVSEGFDKYATTYGKRWCLDERKDQKDSEEYKVSFEYKVSQEYKGSEGFEIL